MSEQTSNQSSDILEAISAKVNVKHPTEYKLTVLEDLRKIEFDEIHKNCRGYREIRFAATTGIGLHCVMYCSGCNTRKDITDYGAW